MEGIKEFIYIEPNSRPYTNRYGYGNSLGCGDIYGCGRCYVNYQPIEKYNGSGIISFNNKPVSFVDDFTVCITHIKEPYALGEVIKNDLTTQKCCLGKVNNHIVISESIRGVISQMRNLIAVSDDIEEDVARAFVLAHPNYEKKYNWDEMVAWHSLIPTSCLDGRRQFTLSAEKNSNSKVTPKELIEFMKHSPSVVLAEKMEILYKNKLGESN